MFDSVQCLMFDVAPTKRSYFAKRPQSKGLEFFAKSALHKKCPYPDYSGPYFSAFGLKAEHLSIFSPNLGKYGPE